MRLHILPMPANTAGIFYAETASKMNFSLPFDHLKLTSMGNINAKVKHRQTSGKTQSLHTLAVWQLYLTASPVQTYKLSILYILRGSGTNPQYPCRFSLQGWSFLRPRGCILRKTAKVKFKRGAESHASFFITPAVKRFSNLLSVINIDSLICLSPGGTSFVHFIALFGKAATSPTR